MPKKPPRYQPGAYKPPEPKDIEVDGLGSFLVKPLSTREQESVEADNTQNDGESDEDHAIRLGYAKMSAALVEPEMTPEQIEADAQEWTPRQGSEFVTEVQLAAHAIDKEDLEEVRSRFRSEEDD